VVCAGERQITLVPVSSRHIAYKGSARANAQTTSLSMQMLGVWAFGLVYVKVGTI
jgi:hypothetical protein